MYNILCSEYDRVLELLSQEELTHQEIAVKLKLSMSKTYFLLRKLIDEQKITVIAPKRLPKTRGRIPYLYTIQNQQIHLDAETFAKEQTRIDREIISSEIENIKDELASKMSDRSKLSGNSHMIVQTCHYPPLWVVWLDELVARGYYPNRSEAMRVALHDLLRDMGYFDQREVK